MLRYKYKDNDAVSFGLSAYNNVINALERAGLNYVIFDEKEQVTNNDNTNEIYELLKKMSSINYKKYLKEENLKKMFERILKSDEKNVNDLDKYLSKKVKELDVNEIDINKSEVG